MILADTDVLIDYLTDTQPAADKVREYSEAGNLQTSAVTCFELLSGAGNNKRGDRVRHLIATIPVLPLDLEAASCAGSLARRLAEAGFSIGVADSLIAGIALVNDLPLLTRNRKHFEAVEGLRLLPVG